MTGMREAGMLVTRPFPIVSSAQLLYFCLIDNKSVAQPTHAVGCVLTVGKVDRECIAALVRRATMRWPAVGLF